MAALLRAGEMHSYRASPLGGVESKFLFNHFHSNNNIVECFRFESCWPALRVGVQGVILVCSPNTTNVAARELELLYNYFVSQPKLSAKQCVVFYNCTDDQDDMDSLSLCKLDMTSQ